MSSSIVRRIVLSGLLLGISCGGRSALDSGDTEVPTGGYTGTAIASGGNSAAAGGKTPAVRASGGAGASVNTLPDASIPPAAPCPLFNPLVPTYFRGAGDSPCPNQLPSNNSVCEASLIQTAQCVYPSLTSDSSQNVCTCYDSSFGGSIPKPLWYCGDSPCLRQGDACFLGPVPNSPLVPIVLSTTCNAQTATHCDATSTDTAQQAADSKVVAILKACGYGSCGLGASLTVNFYAGCPHSFTLFVIAGTHQIVTDASQAECVTQHLQSEVWDCARGLVCATAMPPISNVCLI